MKAKQIFEFKRTKNPKASLGISGVNFNEYIQNEREELEDEINMLKGSCLLRINDYLHENLVGKTITAIVRELPKIDSNSGYQRINGEHTLTVQDISFNGINDTHFIIADTDNKIYSVKLEQKIYIE